MDGAIEKMNSISKEFQRRMKEEKLSREQILDYQQEMYRQYAILNHVGRAYKNPAGRYTGFLFGSIGGYLFGASLFPATARGIKVHFMMASYAFAGGVLGYLAFSSYYGSRSEYAVFKKKKVGADEIYSNFESLIPN